MSMANAVEGAGYWLPSEFLTDDDFVIDKENFNNTADFCFPTESPHDFQSHAHHLLQKFCAMPTSSQLTLANLGSDEWSNNGGTQYDTVGDLICLAKRKLNPCPPPRNLPFQFHKRAEISTPSYLNTSFENIGPRAVRGLGHVAWAPHQGRPALDGSGAAAKKVSAGTGVFLPRRYDAVNDRNAHSLVPRRRPECSASSPFHGRESAQIHTKPLMYSLVESRSQPKFSGGFVSDHSIFRVGSKARLSAAAASSEFSNSGGGGSSVPPAGMDLLTMDADFAGERRIGMILVGAGKRRGSLASLNNKF